jgi:hypothetical protein
MTIEDHDAAVQAAERDLADLKAQIEAAKREHEDTKPTAAVRAGLSLAEAGVRHAAAESQVGFLLDAEEAVMAQVHAAHAARKNAYVQLTFQERFKAAVAKRLDAIRAHEAAKASLETAETDYELATRAIEEALSAGFDRPAHLGQHPLRAGWTIDHATKMLLPNAASEAALWSAYL